MAFGRGYSDDPKIARKAMIAFSLISLWPDLDVIGFPLGVHYGDPWGHRGATHSIILAIVVALVARILARRWGLDPSRTSIFTGIVAVSHPLLDTLTYGGGLGCALAWPFSLHRFWSPVRFIPIAPIGLGMLSTRGLLVSLIETGMFAPFFLYAFLKRKKS